MQCVAYCRISVRNDESVSLEMQQARIAAWCAANGYELHTTFVEIMSGGKATNRPELQKAISAACRLRSEGVLCVFSLSRLARSVRDMLDIAERLEKAGAHLASLTERIDATALGKMVFRLLSTLNEFERDQLQERTLYAMAHLRRCNKRISSRLPYGFDLAADGQTLLVNPAEQNIVHRICKLRSEGRAIARIAHELEAQGVPTKLGGRWGYSSVRGILERQERIGALKSNARYSLTDKVAA